MKKILSIIVLTVICSSVAFAQNSQLAVFVYSDNNSTPTNALRSQLTTSFINGGNSKYEVVDRTDEIFARLKQEYQYQGSGMVRDDQLVSIGDHLAANYICVVAITYYPQYQQYFFDGKIIDVSTRKIVKSILYPNDDKAVISSLDPQTQMRVGKELAKQLDLFSAAQLAEERQKQLREQQERERAAKAAMEASKVLRIGDRYGNNGWKIGYLDETRKHGLIYKVLELEYRPRMGGDNPSRPELLRLYNNRRMLGLYEEYWTRDYVGNSTYYTIDFSTGKQNKRHTQKNKYREIIVNEF